MNNEVPMEFLDFALESAVPSANPVYFYVLNKVAPDASNLTHRCEDRVTFNTLPKFVPESMEIFGHTAQYSMLDSIHKFSSQQSLNDPILKTDQLQLFRPYLSSQERPEEGVILDPIHNFSNLRPAEALISETNHLELLKKWHQETVMLNAMHSFSNQQSADVPIFKTDQLQLSQERQQEMITFDGIHNFSNQQPAEALIFKSDQLQPSQDGQQETVMEIANKNKDEIVTMIASDYAVEMYNPESTVKGNVNCSPLKRQIQHTNPIRSNQNKMDRQGKRNLWTQDNMNSALDAVRTHSMRVIEASVTFGIPKTTLWKQIKKMGIDVLPKSYLWSEEVIDSALNAVRTQNMSLREASLTFRIPFSTLYGRARKMGIDVLRTSYLWTEEYMDSALNAIRTQNMSLREASLTFRIPFSTLYRRARKMGVLRKSYLQGEENIDSALNAVLTQNMSLREASLTFRIPFSTLYRRARIMGVDVLRKSIVWSEEHIDSALNVVQTQNMSLREVSLSFRIPISTLYRHAQKMGINLPKEKVLMKSCTDDSLHLELDASRKDQISSNKSAKTDGMPQEKLNTISNEEETQPASPFCDSLTI